MLDLQTILTFCAAAALLTLAPGPDNIFVLTQSAMHGRGAGIATSFGLCTGLLIHTLAVALGLAAIIQTSVLAFNALKFCGAGYLLYLAWKAFRAKEQSIHSAREGWLPLRKLYLRGIIMNVTNPKVAIFFLAILPQFSDPQRGPLFLQFLSLGGLFILVGLLIMIGFAVAAGTVGHWLTRTPRAQSVLNKLAGLVFIGLALKIATVQR